MCSRVGVWVLAYALAATPMAAQSSTSLPRYQIKATIRSDIRQIDASSLIEVPRSTLTGITTLRFGLQSPGRQRLRISRISDSHDRPVVGSWSSDSLSVMLPVQAGKEPIDLRVAYTVPFDSAGYRSLGYYLFPSVDSTNSWYPVLLSVPDSLRRFLDFTVELDVPSAIALLATGSTVDTARGADLTRYRLKADHVEGFALSFGEGMVTLTLGGNGTRVKVISPVSDTAVFRRVAQETSNAASWYRRTYGFFPVEEIGIVPGSSGSRGGFPLPNVFMIHRGDLSQAFVRWITSHELAHYYWGLHVLDARERLGWLMLGLGIWTDQLYLADVTGTSLETVWRSPDGDNSFDDYAQAMVAGYDQRLDLSSQSADSLSYDYNSLVRHGKAATGIYLLARRLGTTRFVALQKELLESFRHRPLSVDTFALRLEAAGVPNAGALLAAWRKGDARLDYAVRGVRREPGNGSDYWIQIARTGTVPYPLTVEVQSGSARVQGSISGESALDSLRVSLPGPLDRIVLDPDGILPMATSDNPDMQRVFLRALGRSGSARSFLTMAGERVRHDPDPTILALMAERLFELGEWQELLALASKYPALEDCRDRTSCLAATQVARAHIRVGATAEARTLLERLTPAMAEFGLAGSRRLRLARQELDQSGTPR